MVYADTAKARRTANVYVKRGERSKVVTTVRSGKSLKVLARKGRWLKVKVNGRVGWIVRSNVAQSQARKRDRSKRRRAFVSGRSRKRDLRRRSAPKDRYGLDATGTRADDDIVLEDDGTTKPKKRTKKRTKRKTKKKARKKKRTKKKSKKKKSAKNDDEDDDFDDEDFDDEDLDLDDEEELAEDDDEDLDDEDDGPDFVVAKVDVDLRAGKKKSAEEVSFAEPGEKLEVVELDDDWVKVKTADGDVGWVPRDKVKGDGGSSGPGGSGKLAFLVRASLGYSSISQSFTSDDTTSLFGNYDIGATGAVLGAGGELWYDYSKDYWLAAEIDLGYTISTPGIRVEEGMNAADTGFSIFDASVVGKGGYKLHAGTGTVAFARLGYRYQSFQIKNVRDIMNTNLAALPSENLKSPIVGLELAVPRLTDTVSARIVIDTMLIGASRSQTGGLEDGQVSRAKAASASLLATWDYKPNLTLLGSFGYQWAKTEWDGDAMSERKHNAEQAARSDSGYSLNVGVSKGF